MLSKVAKPFTPIMRRFLRPDVFKLSTSTMLGKRGREDDYHNNGRPASDLIQLGSGHLPNCVALQNDDMDEDAVVITALSVIPFCCHADLLTMPRDQLVRVAEALNVKLPLAMKIDTSSARSDIFIRNSIELLVGIRRTVPPAPKPNRSMSFIPMENTPKRQDDDHLPPSPTSPLANRSGRMNSFSFAINSPPLAALNEEDEDDAEAEDEDSMVVDKPLKKRRRVLIEQSFLAVTPSPTRVRLTRSLSQRSPRSNINSPLYTGPVRVFRSQSQKLPQRKILTAHRNVTITRGRGGVCKNYPNGRSQSAVVLTSTPKKRKREPEPEPPTTSSSSLEPLSSLSFPSPPATSPMATITYAPALNRGLKRKASEINEDAADITVGVEGMSMAGEGSGSDMDISLE